MSMLSDRDIWLAQNPHKNPPSQRHLEPLRIVPEPSDEQFQPCSIDLRLGDDFIFWGALKDGAGKVIGHEKRHAQASKFVLKQGQFILASTLEYVEIPRHLCGKIDGKSTLGRQGITAHITAGLIDPGFKGTITLEMKNVGYDHVTLTAGMMVCQLELHRLSSPARRPYGSEGLKSKYQFQAGVTEAR